VLALIGTIAWQTLVGLLVLGFGAWGTGALWYRAGQARGPLIGTWWAACLAGVAGMISVSPAWLWLPSGGLAGLLIWWQTIRPAHARDWASDVARMLHVERLPPQACASPAADIVRLHNVRNFDWRTREDFTPRWETREYDLSQIISTDLICSYWMGPAIAHTLVSFGFADGRYLAFSVEVRRLEGERFSAIGGLFRQCELVVVAADEHDIVRTRSHVRGEDVYLFRVGLPAAQARALCHAYLSQAETLIDHPRFYNTLTSNCTTLIYDMAKRIVPGIPWDYRLLASGYLPEYLHNLGALPGHYTMAELRRRGHIKPSSTDQDTSPDDEPAFSRSIRRHLPVAARG